LDEEVKQFRMRVIKIGAVVFAVCYFVATWYATQNVAAACNYNPVLGRYITLGGIHWYFPLDYLLWCHDSNITKAIPHILAENDKWTSLALIVAFFATYGSTKSLKPKSSHGSASWATAKEIVESDLGEYETKNGGVFPTKKVKIGGKTVEVKDKQVKKSGVVVGINPYTHKLMLHNGPEHMLLMAPTRSGKGVNTIIPTGLIWQNSIFFFDPKGELWANTSGYRKKYFHQKVMKFQPLCTDGSGARWNPLAEVNFRTSEEWPDVTSVVSVMVKPNGEQKGGGDPFWENSAASLLNGVIVHLLYKHYKEHLPLPCPSDIMSFLSSPDVDVTFQTMQKYPHISEEEFLETPILDKDGKPVLDAHGQPKHHINPLKEIYGEYIKDFTPFTKALGFPVTSVEEIRLAILEKRKEGETIDFQENELDPDEKEMDVDADKPWFRLLTHPKVAECASNLLNGADQTRASIMQTAQADLGIYQNPVVQKNTEVSDFAIRDLLDPNQEVSLYLVMEVKDIAMVKPLARLFINTLLNKLIRDMKFSTDPNAPKPKKQRLLLMLDEFPQLGNMESIELALAICAGYGIKICIVCQDVNQLTKAYTKDNSIASNCHVHIYFTPNLDSGGATAEAISKNLGKKTIDTVSHSDGGGGLFKGSDSTSQTGRELMTPDEVSHMSSEKEIVFVAGHKPIFGDKLRYYKNPRLVRRTQLGCPPISDTVTKVFNYDDLFEVHRLDKEAEEEKEFTVLKAKAEQAGITIDEYFEQKKKEREEYEASILKKLHKDDEKDEQDPSDANAESSEEPAHEGARSESAGKMTGRPDHRNQWRPHPPVGNHSGETSAFDRRRNFYRKVQEERDGGTPRPSVSLQKDAPPKAEESSDMNEEFRKVLDVFSPQEAKPKEEETPKEQPEEASNTYDGDEPDFFDDEPSENQETKAPETDEKKDEASDDTPHVSLDKEPDPEEFYAAMLAKKKANKSSASA